MTTGQARSGADEARGFARGVFFFGTRRRKLCQQVPAALSFREKTGNLNVSSRRGAEHGSLGQTSAKRYELNVLPSSIWKWTSAGQYAANVNSPRRAGNLRAKGYRATWRAPSLACAPHVQFEAGAQWEERERRVRSCHLTMARQSICQTPSFPRSKSPASPPQPPHSCLRNVSQTLNRKHLVEDTFFPLKGCGHQSNLTDMMNHECGATEMSSGGGGGGHLT